MAYTYSQGAKLEINNKDTTYVQVKGFKSWSGLGGGSPSVIDVSDLDSTAKEKAMGLADEGQVSVDLNYLPKDDGQKAMKAARNTRAGTKFRITLPDGTKYDFTAYVLTFEQNGGVDNVVEASATLEISGSVAETVAA